MENKAAFRKYYLFSAIGVLIASFYPLWMGARVISDMVINGTVIKENYPKYIIPYTPISIAVITGVLLMPLFTKLWKRFAFWGGAAVAIGIFFASELLFEQKVIVTTTKLEYWQMYMCYIPKDYQTQTLSDILIGNYSPAFKLHFYVISVVIILTVLNCLYGFAQAVTTGETKRTKSLILQAGCSSSFLGLCILACFTAFWRDGSLEVSPLSATLMSVFFILLGVTAGSLVGSFLLGKQKIISVWIPAVTASAMTLLMYIGEMILLHGRLYQFGSGMLFIDAFGIVFAPIDLLIIAASGCITAGIFAFLNCNNMQATE